MNFSHSYLKLENKIFTTIRKEPLEKGKIEPITLKKRFLFNAKVIMCLGTTLRKIPLPFLLMDTMNSEIIITTRTDVESLFQSFYINKINFSMQGWYIILLVRWER